jgi:hypothetical protein
MEQKVIRHRYHEKIIDIAGKVEMILHKALPGNELSTATSFVVAELLRLQDSPTFPLRNLTLEDLLDVYVGQALLDKLPAYLALHAQLEAEEALSFEKCRTFGRSEYSIYALPTKTYDTGGGIIVKAMVLQTLEGNFLVVLNHRYTWTVHFRQFWPLLDDALQSTDWLPKLEEHRNANNLTLLDVAKLSSAMSNFSDDYPGVIHPARPSLASFLAGKLIAGEQSEGHGLRYGDGRDCGYIASLRDAAEPRAYEMCHSSLPTLHVVGNLLAKAMKSIELPSV